MINGDMHVKWSPLKVTTCFVRLFVDDAGSRFTDRVNHALINEVAFHVFTGQMLGPGD